MREFGLGQQFLFTDVQNYGRSCSEMQVRRKRALNRRRSFHQREWKAHEPWVGRVGLPPRTATLSETPVCSFPPALSTVMWVATRLETKTGASEMTDTLFHGMSVFCNENNSFAFSFSCWESHLDISHKKYTFRKLSWKHMPTLIFSSFYQFFQNSNIWWDYHKNHWNRRFTLRAFRMLLGTTNKTVLERGVKGFDACTVCQ